MIDFKLDKLDELFALQKETLGCGFQLYFSLRRNKYVITFNNQYQVKFEHERLMTVIELAIVWIKGSRIDTGDSRIKFTLYKP